MSGRFNGQTGELLRWAVGLALAALVSYFTAMASLQENVARVDERQAQFQNEVLRRFDSISTDVRDIRERLDRDR